MPCTKAVIAIVVMYVFVLSSVRVVHSEGATTLAANPTNNVMSNGGTPTGGFKWSTTVPTTAYDGPVLLKCAAGNMGNTAYNGVNCLLQYNPEDYNGRTLEICQNVVGVAGCYPVFQTTRLGLTAANQIHINSTNYGDTTNYLPTGFPSQGDGCSAALCIMNDTPQIGSLYANFRNFALATNRYSGTPPPFEERHCNVLTNGYNVTQSDLCYLATDARQGASGVGIMHEYVKYRVRSTAQLDATSTTTLADITGLSVYVEATRTYEFTAEVNWSAASTTPSFRVAIGGTATVTSARVTATLCHSSTSTSCHGMGTSTTLTNVFNGSTFGTADAGVVRLHGIVVVNAAGTLTVQGAQGTSSASTTSFPTNSTLKVEGLL